MLIYNVHETFYCHYHAYTRKHTAVVNNCPIKIIDKIMGTGVQMMTEEATCFSHVELRVFLSYLINVRVQSFCTLSMRRKKCIHLNILMVQVYFLRASFMTLSTLLDTYYLLLEFRKILINVLFSCRNKCFNTARILCFFFPLFFSL